MPVKLLETDICIIGAGPSGTTTSLFLSKMGIHHIIVDAAVFPRDKVCGDALDLKVLRVLNQLDPSLVQHEILNDDNFIKAWGCRIISGKNNKDLSYNPVVETDVSYPFMMVSKRAYFDNFLVKKIDPSYARFMQGTKVKQVTKEGDNWKILAQNEGTEIEINSRLIVGADGDHSVVLQSVGSRKVNRDHYAAGVRQYWQGISGIHAGNLVEVYFPKKLPLAYLWIFPLPGGEANVGCGLTSKIVSEKSVNLKELLETLIREDPAIAHRFRNAHPLEKIKGWGLPFASLNRKAAGDGWLLVGDAASLICPTTGEGVGPGMMSGYIAAHFIQRAVENNRYDKQMFENYDREISRRLLTDIRNYNIIRMLSPHVYNMTVNFLSALGFAEYYFRKQVVKWVMTAKKPIDIDL